MTKKRYFFIGVGLAIFLLLIPLVHNFVPVIEEFLNTKHDQRLLQEVFKHADLQNAVILMGLIVLSSAIPGVSSSLFCIFVGILYGSWIAIPLNILGNALGNLTSFEILRRIEKSEKSKRMERLLTYLERCKHKFLGISLAFSVPFIPSALVNYACIQMKFPTKTRIAATFSGVMPISIVYAFGGDLLVSHRPIRIQIGIILVVLVLVSILVYSEHFRKEKHELHQS